MEITFTDAAGKDHPITHDLNFQSQRYETKHVIVFKNPKPQLLALLRNSGPIPGESAADAGVNGANSSKKRSSAANEENIKRKKQADSKGIDMDKLADGLQKLGEDDLLQVVQMVHDNKSEDSWMRNDVDREFWPSSSDPQSFLKAPRSGAGLFLASAGPSETHGCVTMLRPES